MRVCYLWCGLCLYHYRLKEWPRKQHEYQSTCLLTVTHEENEVRVLHNNIESSGEKHVTQYEFKAKILIYNMDCLVAVLGKILACEN